MIADLDTDITDDALVLRRLTPDLKAAAQSLARAEARYLADFYYLQQRTRIRFGNEVAAIERVGSGEPHTMLDWLFRNARVAERDVALALDMYSLSQVPGRWARSILGIGPVLSGALLAYIDVTRAPTVGHIWRFAGLDPTVTWAKGQKRPWNAGLKVVCWKIGQSFQKVAYNEKDIYGHVYLERKELEVARNDAGQFAEQAVAALRTKNYGHDTEAYKAYSEGRLPKGHLDARARRYAVKLFLAHYHHVAFETEYHEAPPKPYVIEHLGHAHYLAPPGWPVA